MGDTIEGESPTCWRFRFLATLARFLYPTTPTVHIRLTLYDASAEYVKAWINQEGANDD